MVAGWKFGETDLPRLRLDPRTRSAVDPVAEIHGSPQVGEHGETKHQRMGRGIEFRVLDRQIVAQYGGDEGLRQDGFWHRRGEESGEPAAGSHPEGTVGLRKVCVRVTVVPDQAVGSIVGDPASAIEPGDAAVGTEPVPAACVEKLGVDHVAGKIVLDGKVAQLQASAVDFDAGNSNRREIGNPERPIGAHGDRLNRIVLETIRYSQQTAHLPLLNVQTLIAGNEQALFGG